MSAKPDLFRLASAVRARREELDLTQDQVALAGGPSNTKLGQIENGVGAVAAATLRKLDKGLRWKPGSAREVLAGGEPQVLDEHVAVRDLGAELMAVRELQDRDHALLMQAIETLNDLAEHLTPSQQVAAREGQSLGVLKRLAGDAEATAPDPPGPETGA